MALGHAHKKARYACTAGFFNAKRFKQSLQPQLALINAATDTINCYPHKQKRKTEVFPFFMKSINEWLSRMHSPYGYAHAAARRCFQTSR